MDIIACWPLGVNILFTAVFIYLILKRNKVMDKYSKNIEEFNKHQDRFLESIKKKG